MPAAVLAAYNDVTTDGTSQIVYPGNGAAYTMGTDMQVESFSLSDTNMSFVVDNISKIVLTSTDKSSFSVGHSGCAVTFDCGLTASTLTVQCPVYQTVTVVPSGTCQSTNTGGNGGNGGGGGGGGGAGTVSMTTVVALEVNKSTPVAVGGITHTATVLSATADLLKLKIESEPITADFAKNTAKDVDTSGDKKTDLRVTYLGLEAGKAKVQFTKLAAAEQKAVEEPSAPVTAPAKPVACGLATDKAYKKSGSPAVYYVSAECTKRPFNNSAVFFSYFPSWKDVKSVSAKDLDAVAADKLGFMPWGPKYDPQYGAVAKIVSDPKVYLLLGQEKYWITNEQVFTKLGYQWSWVEDIDPRLLDKYATGSEISDLNRHPNYTLVKYAQSPKVYRLEPDPKDSQKQVKRHIKNEAAFTRLKYRWDRVITLKTAETYPDGAALE
ncbi:MAG: hypothetical protein UY92_C0013G0055 [Candidatus Magasanikbacteria bacterium GW2011_GWA2_56_11]|uniref:Uncharacterized protein n=1 Tax=Candidatus Magasanikbacteria bacterium GW2011_GWA2_56_11 TaxID=1619044 RepID=A0A0G1YF49_9BACT|nr:MAG: hypothetical protein UY92_C0013G0055 [Candidatus Magasanikbacteria bacterium GW2011_GWA2_56_11]